MPWTLRIAAFLLCAAATAAAAQDGAVGPLYPPADDFDFGAGALSVPVPFAPDRELPAAMPLPGARHQLMLEARLVPEGTPLGSGLVWRVFGTRLDPQGQLPLLATAEGGTTTVDLPSGDYLIHATFGRAGATKRVTLADDDQMETLVLDAGGLRLGAMVGEDEPVAAEHMSFEILQENQDGDLVTIVPKAAPGPILRLAAGTYHVISRYGGVNSVVRADIEVEPGKLTEAVMRHTGAEVTLKLVSAEGGEALANTKWAVLTENADTVHESIGAFPSLVLAEGKYTAVATHQDQVYSRDFQVESGIERDVEVRLSDLLPPEPDLPPNAAHRPSAAR